MIGLVATTAQSSERSLHPVPAASVLGHLWRPSFQTGIVGYKTKPDGVPALALPDALPPDMTSVQEASGRSRIVPKTDRLTRSSRWLHKIDHYTSQPWATLLLGAILVAAVVLGAIL